MSSSLFKAILRQDVPNLEAKVVAGLMPPHLLGFRLALTKPTRRGRFLQNGHRSLPGPILPTRMVCGNSGPQECFRNRLSNASKTLNQRPTFSPRCVHSLCKVSWPMGKALWGATSTCASVPGSSHARPLTPDSAHKFGTPCIKTDSARFSLQWWYCIH